MGLSSSSRRSNSDENISLRSNTTKVWKRTKSLRSIPKKLRNSLKRSNTDLPRRRPKYVNGTDLVSKILEVERDPFSTDFDILKCRAERRRYQTNMFEDDLDTCESETEDEWDW